MWFISFFFNFGMGFVFFVMRKFRRMIGGSSVWIYCGFRCLFLNKRF